jgi:hypothetical protein
MRSEAIEATGSSGTSLRLEFIWLGDRYGQRISLIDAKGAAQQLLESIEGTPHDAWPPSPPLQSLTIETRPNGQHAALLLGMAGRCHWSASIETAEGKAALIFDIACRHGENPGHLGSLYRRLSPLVNIRLSALECRDATVSEAGDIVEIIPLFVMLEGTSRWRFAVACKN